MPVDDKVKNVLSLKNVSKSFYGRNRVFEAVNNVSLDVRENEFLVLLGPGQCGKSVLLNIISGLDTPTLGEVEFPDEKDRDVGFVFQKTALFPWKTVMENVELPLQLAGVGKAERREKAQYLINLVGLQGFEDALPKQLSGGMKQRVVIGRAFAVNPDLLLMDEPYGQMDIKMRYYLEDEVIRLWEATGSTVLFITHNLEEAVYLAQRVLILSNKPAKIKANIPVDLPRPRKVSDPEFIKIRKEITDMIKWW